jgi:hypothetical protein
MRITALWLLQQLAAQITRTNRMLLLGQLTLQRVLQLMGAQSSPVVLSDVDVILCFYLPLKDNHETYYLS